MRLALILRMTPLDEKALFAAFEMAGQRAVGKAKTLDGHAGLFCHVINGVDDAASVG